MNRKDLVEAGLVRRRKFECGFTIEFPYEEGKNILLINRR